MFPADVQDFNSQEFELIIIFGIVSAGYIAVYSSSWHCNWSAVSVEMVFKSSFKSSQVNFYLNTQDINEYKSVLINIIIKDCEEGKEIFQF